MKDKIKDFLSDNKKDIIIFLLIFLLCSISFGLGYLVNREFNRAPIIIEKYSNWRIGQNIVL